MEFELETRSLSDRPVYTAISYYWGGPAGAARPKKPITVNGQTFWIQDSLEEALKNIQYEDIAPAIWIDSICINQQDYVEKSDQVEKMRQIYSSASHVIVWLGAATQHSDFLAGALRGFGNQFRRHFNVPKNKKWDLLEYFNEDKMTCPQELYDFLERCLDDPIVENPEDHPYDTAGFIHWFLVFSSCRHWWYRVWIIQEFVFAQKVFFQTGMKKFSLDEFGCLLALITIFKVMRERLVGSAGTQQPANPLLESKVYEWPMKLIVAREQARKKTSRTTYQVLLQAYCLSFKDRPDLRINSTNDKDYIYGLVGLFEDDFHKLTLKVNYLKTCESIYIEVAEKIIYSGELDLLALCQKPDQTVPGNLPSWTPDWRKQIRFPNMWFLTDHEGSTSRLGNSLFSAALPTRLVVSFVSKIDPGKETTRRMMIYGILVDTIHESKSAYHGTNSTKPSDLNLLYGNLFRDILQLCKKSKAIVPRVYSTSALREAPWRTIVRDHEVGMNEDGYRRATKLSRARYYTYLPMMKAVEADLKLQDLSVQDPHQPKTTVKSLYRAYYKTRIFCCMTWFYTNQYLKLKCQHLSYWIKLKLPGPFLRIFNLHINEPSTELQNSEYNMYMASMQTTPFRPFITRRGYIGIGPRSLELGDIVCIFFGARVPHILRPRIQGDHRAGYFLVGEAYMYGMMDGELVNREQEKRVIEIH